MLSREFQISIFNTNCLKPLKPLLSSSFSLLIIKYKTYRTQKKRKLSMISIHRLHLNSFLCASFGFLSNNFISLSSYYSQLLRVWDVEALLCFLVSNASCVMRKKGKQKVVRLKSINGKEKFFVSKTEK